MKIFDLKELETEIIEKKGVNVFYKNNKFKTRLIVVESGGKIPECQMDSYVLFYVMKGEINIRKNSSRSTLKENQLFISEPALLSIESSLGARILGIQINN